MTENQRQGNPEPRIALVTGAGSGIGKAAASRLAADGFFVIVADVNGAAAETCAEEISASGGSASTVEIDITDAGGLVDVVDEIGSRHRRLDVVVHSAGISHRPGATVELEQEVWRRVIDVNLTGSFNVCRAALPLMLAGGYGRIVLISSIAGKEGNARHAAYSASKGGVIALAKSLGKELATTGVIVNAVTPGIIETPLVLAEERQLVAAMTAQIPMQRWGQVEEVAALISWLSSTECSFTTGAVFDISGGRATY